MKDIKKDIKTSRKKNRLVPFVGSGISMCVDGFPSWDDLLQKLTEELQRQDPAKAQRFSEFKQTPWARAEYFERLANWGKDEVASTIKKLLEEGECNVWNEPKKLECQMLLAKHFARVYTTNYDHLLERAGELCNRGVVNIYDMKSAVRSRDQRTEEDDLEVIKYHGDYDYWETICLTEGDYFDRLLDVDAKDILLMADLLFRDLLFLGYSFQDDSLKVILQQMLRLLEEIDPRILTEDYKGRRPRLFLVTTEARRPYLEYLEKAYLVSCISVLDYCNKSEIDTPNLNPLSKFVYKKTEPAKVSGDTVVIGDFSHLWLLAQNSYLNSSEFKEKAQPVFPSASDTDLRLLTQKCEGFRTLRSKVMYVCYSMFLKKILSLTP